MSRKKYKEQIPSPVSLDYPYRNLTGILQAIPSSLTEDETKDRLNQYLDALKQKQIKEETSQYSKHYPIPYDAEYITKARMPKTPPSAVYDDLNEDIASAYAKDLVGEDFKNYDKIFSDGGFADKFIKNDLGLDDITKEMIIPERHSNEVGYISKDKRANINDNFDFMPSPIVQGNHYDDLSRAGIHLPSPLNSDDFEDAINNADMYNEIFKMDNRLKGKKDPQLLMRPFEKAGMKPNPSSWEKIKSLFKK